MLHPDFGPGLGCPERGGEGDVADVAAGELELTREEIEVYVLRERRVRREHAPPDPQPVLAARRREVDRVVHPARERLVDVAAEIRREDHQAAVLLELLQQVRDLDVGVAVVRILHLRALAEERVRLVEEEDRVRAFGGGEDPVEVLLGLPDVLRDDGGQVNAEELEPELARQHLGGHRLARAGLAREEHLQALRAGDGPLVAPFGEHEVAVAEVSGDRAEHFALALRQDEIVPGERRIEARRELAEPRARGLAGAQVEVGGRRASVAPRRRGEARNLGRLGDLAHRQPELGRDVGDVLRVGERRPRRFPLCETRQRRLDDEHRLVAERHRGVARGRAEERALVECGERPQHAAAVARLQLADPVEREPSTLERAGERGLPHELLIEHLGDVHEENRPLECRREQGGRVRTRDHDRKAALDRDQAAELRHHLFAPGIAVR